MNHDELNHSNEADALFASVTNSDAAPEQATALATADHWVTDSSISV